MVTTIVSRNTLVGLELSRIPLKLSRTNFLKHLLCLKESLWPSKVFSASEKNDNPKEPSQMNRAGASSNSQPISIAKLIHDNLQAINADDITAISKHWSKKFSSKFLRTKFLCFGLRALFLSINYPFVSGS